MTNFPSRCLRAQILSASFLLVFTGSAFSQFANFITARGDKLMDGKEELRFVSYNIPNLHYIEDNLAFSEPNPWRIADEFEIRDALLSIKQMGGKVTRMYVPSIRKESDDSVIVRHVLGPGLFDEEAFKAYDKVLEVANQTGVRLIIPLVDNWWWWGGPKEYAAFRGKGGEDFWTDSLLIADFKKTIAFIINRVNTRTGVPFKQDKAILGWETGNELVCPYAWTRQIAAYIKSLDSVHLVIHGTNSREISDDALADPNIDVLSTHHYTGPEESIAQITTAREKARGKKPYFVGEFGFIPTTDMRRIIDTVISQGISGIMVWSLRGHNRDGGFYYHSNAYRWPGFASGAAWDESAVIGLFREKAYQINGRVPEPVPAPDVPRLLSIESPYKISWQGSTGAAAYLIERKSDEDLFWKVIEANASDADARYRPLYMDTTVEIGKRYFYRIRAKNSSGFSELSDAVGPVRTENRMLIDEMGNVSKLFAKSDGVHFVAPQDESKAKEDNSRLEGGSGDFIIYKLPASVLSVQVDIYVTKQGAESDIQLLSGTSDEILSVLPCTRRVYRELKNEYGFYTPVTVLSGNIPPEQRFVKLVLAAGCQIGRVEIAYGAQHGAGSPASERRSP